MKSLFKNNLAWLFVSLCLVTMFGLMFFSAKGESNIVDEIAHIPAGYSYITTGDYRLNPEHPPLIKDLSGLAIMAARPNFPYGYWKANTPVINNQWETGWRFIYRSGNNPELINLLGRLPIMLISLVLGYFVYKWAKELYGWKAGVFALVLYVFNTNILAHSRYVTTDLGISAAFFINMYALYHYIKAPNFKNILWASLTFGIVLVTKFSAAVLVPTYLIIFLMLLIKKGTKGKKTFWEKISSEKAFERFKLALLSFGLIGVLGFFMMWGFYFFHTMNMPAQVQKDLITESLGVNSVSNLMVSMSGNPVLKPLVQYFLGFSMVASHVQGGHDAFLLGQVSNQGWWYYYPVVIALKTQIPIFLFLIISFILGIRNKKKDWFTGVFLWSLPVVLLAMGIQGKINLGIRYMLPIYPFIFVFVSPLANLLTRENLTRLKKKALLAWIILFGLGWYILSGILTYPHYLSYYNEFIGGGKNGYKYLTDSNTDWGQDVKRLSKWVEKNNINSIYVDVFPGAMPAQYYLGDKMTEWHVQNGRPRSYFAVSATFYQNSRLKKDKNQGLDYSWLDNEKPIENLGGSILIYDLR